MSHDSMQAAIIYRYATTEADARIAVAVDLELATPADVEPSAVVDDPDGRRDLFGPC